MTILEKIETASTENSLRTAEGRFETRLAEEIGKLRADLIRWTFIFIFGQFWMIIGTLFLFFK